VNINLTLFSQALAFAIFIWFTVRFVWPPLIKAIEERQKQIAEGLAAADAGRKSLDTVAQQVAEIEKEARKKSFEIIEMHENRAKQIIADARDEAHAKAERIIAQANEEAQHEAARARETLRVEVGNLVVQGVEKILRREIDPKTHVDILNQLRKEL